MDKRRNLSGVIALCVAIIAITIPVSSLVYSLQLLPKFGIIIYREQFLALFLSFCMAITFVAKPSGRTEGDHAPLYDIVLALIALAVGCYIFFWYDQIVRTLGLLTTDKIVVSAAGLLLLLECARRQAGLTMVSVGLVALAYAYFGHFLSGMFETRTVSWERLATYNYLGTGAVLGTPVYVAATVVASFVIFGQMLFLVGGGDAISDFALALMGRRRGGPAKVAILSSALFGSLSGSASANVATTGMLTIPMMRRVGYSAEKAAAVEAVASTGGLVLPPVMAATGFLMAEFLGVPYSTIALSAAVPALLFYFCLYLQIDLGAAKDAMAGTQQAEIIDLRAASLKVLPVIVPFAVLLYALFELNWNPAAAAFAGTFATFLLSLVVPSMRRPLGAYVRTIASAGEATVFITIMCAVAGIVVGCLGLTGLGSSLSQNLVAMSGGNVWMLLGFSAVGCIVLGMGVPVTATYIILVILIGPAFVQLGVEPLAAHMFIFYFGTLSFLTPPVCLSVFVAASLANAAPMKTAMLSLRFAIVAYVIPFAFVLNTSYLLQGDWQNILASLIAGGVGVYLLSISIVGYFVRPVGLAFRVLVGVAGFASIFLVHMNWWIAPAALVFLAALFAGQRWMSAKEVQAFRPELGGKEV